MIEAAAALEALKAIIELSKTMLDGGGGAKSQAALSDLHRQNMDLQRFIMQAQQVEATLVARVKQLEQEAAELRHFVADASRYPLTEVGTGAFARVGRATDDASSPEVWLCAPCFQRHKAEILQLEGRTPDRAKSIYGCPSCKARIQVHYAQRPNKPREPAA